MESALISDEIQKKYNSLSLKERDSLHKLFKDSDQFSFNYNELKKVIFKKTPPTPEEYIDSANGWITPAHAQSLREWVKEDFCNIINGSKDITIASLYGATRCEAENTEILMYDLSVKMIQDIKTGDLLMGPDGKPRKVLETVKGYGDLYRVKQNKGDDYIVNENHVLVLQYTNKGLRKERNNAVDKYNGQIIEIPVYEYLEFSKDKKNRLKGIRSKLDFEEISVPIDPYFIGLWNGDGSAHQVSITTMDFEIKDYIYKIANNYNLGVTEHIKKNNKAGTYCISGFNNERDKVTGRYINPLLEEMKKLKLIKNKHIPTCYIKNSKDVRMGVLAGLIDSDGSIIKNNSGYEIIQKNKKLADDIVLLARSLGFRVGIKKSIKSIKRLGFFGEYWRISIFGQDIINIPLKLKRKKINKSSIRVNPLRTGISVISEGKGNFYGFALDGDQRYLHSDLTITHNTGKSFLANLLMMYTIDFWACLRDPNAYYEMAPNTSLSMFILSFDYKKVHEVYLQPLYKTLEDNPRFINVKFQDQVHKDQKKYPNKVVWSKASLIGHITLASGLNIVSGNSDALAIIGSNILCSFISEIAFFIEDSGASEEQIYRLYTDISERIGATVGLHAHLSYTYLDSSANNSESMIEKHILKDLAFRDNVYFRRRARWDVKELIPKQFKIWGETGETFWVCSGDGTYPPKIILDKNDPELDIIPKDLLIAVPIDALQRFQDNLTKSIKDIAGVPTTSESKLISDGTLIERIFDNELLQNIPSIIIADSSEYPDTLIWDKIKSQFFLRTNEIDYMLRRAPRELRWIGIDLAFSLRGDVAGISMGHKEWHDERSQIMYVTDFSFVVGPGENGINLESIADFILCLGKYGKVPIEGVYYDTFSSEPMTQKFMRNNIPYFKQSSVDKTLDPYLFLFSLILNDQFKAGKNIFLKNNLRSLYRVKNKGIEKIDHSSGKTNNIYNGDWIKSEAGVNAKDCSDAVAQWLYPAYLSLYKPTTSYLIENTRFVGLSEITKTKTLVGSSPDKQLILDKMKEDMNKILHKMY